MFDSRCWITRFLTVFVILTLLISGSFRVLAQEVESPTPIVETVDETSIPAETPESSPTPAGPIESPESTIEATETADETPIPDVTVSIAPEELPEESSDPDVAATPAAIVELSDEDELLPFAFTSFNCETGTFTIEINLANPNAPNIYFMDVTLVMRDAISNDWQHSETYSNTIHYTNPGNYTDQVDVPIEGGIHRITLSANELGRSSTISCDTPDYPDSRIHSIDCSEGTLTIKSSGEISERGKVLVAWNGDYPNYFELLGPQITEFGIEDMELGIDLDVREEFSVSLFYADFVVDHIECSADMPWYFRDLPPGDYPAVAFEVYEAYVGDTVRYQVSDFPPDAPLQVILGTVFGDDLVIETTARTDENGDALGEFVIPAVYGQQHHVFRIAVGYWKYTNMPGYFEHYSLAPGEFHVKSRLVAAAGVYQPGQTVQLELTGGPYSNGTYGIEWLIDGEWQNAGQVVLNYSGTTQFSVVVPSDAVDGTNRIRVNYNETTVVVSNVVVTPTPTPAPAPNVTLSTVRTTVNNNVSFTVVGFAKNRPLTVTWKRPGGSSLLVLTTQTNASGEASGVFKVPATEGGNGNRIVFTASSVTRTVVFDVAPRIKLIPGEGVRGGTVEISLRGYTKNEVVRIRWKIGSSYVLIRTVTMSNTGSANFTVTIPDNAPFGVNSVRADGTVWRQQTNAFIVTG